MAAALVALSIKVPAFAATVLALDLAWLIICRAFACDTPDFFSICWEARWTCWPIFFNRLIRPLASFFTSDTDRADEDFFPVFRVDFFLVGVLRARFARAVDALFRRDDFLLAVFDADERPVDFFAVFLAMR